MLIRALTILTLASGMARAAEVSRADFFVPLPSGERLFLREVRLVDDGGADAVLLIHGARVPGIGSFDLPVAGGSIAADLAAAGHRVFLLDLRGYGRSSRPAAMEGPPGATPPLERTEDAVADIAAAVVAIRARTGDAKVALGGWATGGHWAGAYASVHPEQVEKLFVLNTLYGGSKRHPTMGPGSPMDDPKAPGSFNAAAYGGYRLNTRASLYLAWDDSIPNADKDSWRDPVVAAAYGDAPIASDETAASRAPPTFRSPSGALADSFELANDRRQWRAADLTMPVLVIRSGRDFWSRPEDARTLAAEAPMATLLEFPDATHFIHLDRDGSGRGAFLKAVLAFLD